jgi:hypothetical protein
MLQTLPEKAGDVLIIQGVKHLPSGFSRPYQSHLTQTAQLVGDGRFAHPDAIGERADIHLFL